MKQTFSPQIRSFFFYCENETSTLQSTKFLYSDCIASQQIINQNHSSNKVWYIFKPPVLSLSCRLHCKPVYYESKLISHLSAKTNKQEDPMDCRWLIEANIRTKLYMITGVHTKTDQKLISGWPSHVRSPRNAEQTAKVSFVSDSRQHFSDAAVYLTVKQVSRRKCIRSPCIQLVWMVVWICIDKPASNTFLFTGGQSM